MDRLGYEVFKVESSSAVCPPDICPGARTRRPGVLARLAGGGRPARFHRWVGAIRRRPEPSFYFHHGLMPHEPWIYLPSGRQVRPAGNDPIELNKLPGFDQADLSVHNHLRHLLQVGYTDHQVGELLARLRRTGLLRRSLIIVTADHGYSFQVGVRSRRLLSDRNVEEIAPVPFFVKAPGQTEGPRGPEPRPQHRHRCDDRGPARQPDVLQAGRPLGVLRGHEGAEGVQHPHARLRPGGAHRPARDAAPPRAVEAALGAPVRDRGREQGALRQPVGDGLPDRAEQRAARQARGGRSGADEPPPCRARECGALPRREPQREVLPHARDGAVAGRAVRGAPRRGGRGERTHPGRGPQLRPLVQGPRVLLAAGPRVSAAHAGATASRCSRCCRPARSRAFSACRPSSARRWGPRRSSPGPCLRR